MQHYFAKELLENKIIFCDDDVHHIKNVMRFKTGDQVIAVFNYKKYLLNLFVSKEEVYGEIAQEMICIDNSLDITLIHGMPKADKFELSLQKATELGVKKIVPFLSERSVIRLDEKDGIKKVERWSKIVKEASEQSERIDIPNVEMPIHITQIGNFLSDINIVCDENLARTKGISLLSYLDSLESVGSVTLLVGPEGGFSEKEFNEFKKLGFISVGLGKRILRSETAVISALSIIGAKTDVL